MAINSKFTTKGSLTFADLMGRSRVATPSRTDAFIDPDDSSRTVRARPQFSKAATQGASTRREWSPASYQERSLITDQFPATDYSNSGNNFRKFAEGFAKTATARADASAKTPEKSFNLLLKGSPEQGYLQSAMDKIEEGVFDPRKYSSDELAAVSGVLDQPLPGNAKPDNRFLQASQEAAERKFRTPERVVKSKRKEEVQSLADMFSGGDGTVQEISKDQFDKLTPQQQAAILFNTDLYNAISQDRALGAGVEVAPDYVDRVSALFDSEDRRGNRYAPALVDFLERYGVSDYADTATLDDFFDLKGGITSKELDALGDGSLESLQDPRSQYVLDTVMGSMSTLSDTLAKGQSLLDQFQGSTLHPAFEDEATKKTILDFLEYFDSTKAGDDEVAKFYGEVEHFTGATPQETSAYLESLIQAESFARGEHVFDSETLTRLLGRK